MILNNASKGMWLRVYTANQKLKQNAETQEVDGMEALSDLRKTQLEGVSQQ